MPEDGFLSDGRTVSLVHFNHCDRESQDLKDSCLFLVFVSALLLPCMSLTVLCT